ncbi:MAG: hemolysin secretion protein D [Alphaproteobacteria bacterium BRH_c36]|nr:MAG: hemolysin secretion protein D [Alphaproteobacteria bacterium BRH_c36]
MSEIRLRALLSASMIAVLLVFTAYQRPASAQAPPPPVSVAKPLAKKVTQWDEFSGRFEPVESVEVRPRVSGFIEKIHFKDGQTVKAGDPLFSIDQRPFEIEVESAEATIEQRKAEVELQLSEVERARPLVDSRTLTRRDFETREANLAVARAQLSAAEATLRAALLDLEWATVVAPISGRLSDRRVDVGALVTGGAGASTLLTTIVTLHPIYFMFDGSEADYLRYIRLARNGSRPSSRDEGNPVRIKLADEDEWNWTGKMDFVDNRLDARSGTIRGRAVIENPDRFLTPGLFGRMQLFGGEFDALLVPDKAIVSDQARKIVFTVGEGDVVAAKSVELGQLQPGGLRVIKSGLTPDDLVVINGIANPAVRPGAKVAPEAGEIVSAQSN